MLSRSHNNNVGRKNRASCNLYQEEKCRLCRTTLEQIKEGLEINGDDNNAL